MGCIRRALARVSLHMPTVPGLRGQAVAAACDCSAFQRDVCAASFQSDKGHNASSKYQVKFRVKYKFRKWNKHKLASPVTARCLLHQSMREAAHREGAKRHLLLPFASPQHHRFTTIHFYFHGDSKCTFQPNSIENQKNHSRKSCFCVFFTINDESNLGKPRNQAPPNRRIFPLHQASEGRLPNQSHPAFRLLSRQNGSAPFQKLPCPPSQR